MERAKYISKSIAILYIICGFFSDFVLGRPKKTSCSHNAGATTYRSANHLEFSTISFKQQLLTEIFLKGDNNPTSSSVGVE